MSRAITRAHGRAQQQAAAQQPAAINAAFAAADFHGAEHYQLQQQPEAGGTQDDESSTTPSNAGHHDGSSQAAVANNNNIDNGTAAPPAAAAAAAANNRTNRVVSSNRLLRLRQNFNATGVRREARSASTFDGHHRNNIRFLLYIYGNKPELLVEELRRQLDDANAEPDYSDVERLFPIYVRRGGKKSFDERKEEFRQKLLKQVISDALGPPGTTPPRQVIDFDAFTADVDIFVDYVIKIRKEDGSFNKAGTYAGHRSSLTYLFRRYRYFPPPEFNEDLKEGFEGVKRILNRMEHYRNEHKVLVKEAMTLLELALWKAKLHHDAAEQEGVRVTRGQRKRKRKDSCITSGASIVIKNVLPFLAFEG